MLFIEQTFCKHHSNPCPYPPSNLMPTCLLANTFTLHIAIYCDTQTNKLFVPPDTRRKISVHHVCNSSDVVHNWQMSLTSPVSQSVSQPVILVKPCNFCNSFVFGQFADRRQFAVQQMRSADTNNGSKNCRQCELMRAHTLTYVFVGA